MSKHYLMICAIAMAGAAPVAATAAPATAPRAAPAAQAPQPMSRTQFLSNIQTRFSAVDANHDGALDASEVSAAQQRELQQARATE